MGNYIAASSVRPAIGRVELTKPRVLCVDDNELILEVLWEALTDNGFRVGCECDSERAQSAVRSMEIDAVILDYDMPRCDGLKLAKTVKKHKTEGANTNVLRSFPAFQCTKCRFLCRKASVSLH